ncbi:MAG: hypothetical protein HOP28_04625 [Gemmatimonadales bacterium]|nr:hypothetical protein [Gemmatimonadales bacterium]
MNAQRASLLWFAALLSVPVSAAQTPVVFERFAIDRGLSQNSVRTVLTDSTGFVWIGSQDGLNRYDGNTFKVFRRQDADSASLSSNYILSLREEPGGILWVGTGFGLNRFDTRTGRFTRYFFPSRDSIPANNWIRTQLRDRSGRLWVGTQEGIGWLDESAGQLRRYPVSGIRPLTPIIDIVEDKAGLLWIGTTGDGLVRLGADRRSATSFRATPGIAGSLLHDTIRALYEDAQGTLWIGSRAGLMRFDGAAQRFIPVPLSSDPRHRDPSILAIVPDSTGALWIATDGSGIFRLAPDAGDIRHFLSSSLDPASLGSNVAYDIAVERGGAIWVGTIGSGANRLDPGMLRFGVVREAPAGASGGLKSAFVQAMLAHPDGSVWLGVADEGLYRFDRKSKTLRHLTPRIDTGAKGTIQGVRALALDRTGGIWMSAGAVTYRLDPATERLTTLRVTGAPPSFRGATPALLVDRRNGLWITDELMIVRVDSTHRRVTRAEPIPDGNVLFEDRRGAIWAGTDNGLYRFDNDSAPPLFFGYHSGDSTSLSNNDVRSIVEDKAGTVWVGTAAGLNAFDRTTNRFRQVRLRHGLTNEFIYAILPDPSGDLWLSTNLGIERLSVGTGRIRRYDQRDGLQSNEFNSNAAVVDTGGVFYFGGISGFNHFDPRTIIDNPIVPGVVISDFKRFNRSEELSRLLDARGRLVLPARDNLISFEFSALSYRLPEKNRYAYRLEGFDREWIELGTKREATYTNLDPGTYTLRVKASNNDGVWNDQGLALPIVITPRWWQTLWFRVLAVVTLAGTLAAGVGLRFRAIRSRNRELEQLVAERTREIRRQEVALREVSRRAGMAEVATGVLHNVGNVFNGVNVAAAVIEGLVKRSKIPDFVKAMGLFRSHDQDLGRFLTEDARGKQLPGYLEKVADQLSREREGILGELASMNQGITLVTQIISAQQSLAGAEGVEEEIDLGDLVDDVVRHHTQGWATEGIAVQVEREPLPPVLIDRHQITQVVLSLLTNARAAVLPRPDGERRITVRVTQTAGERPGARVQVLDTGVGIAPEHLVSIFSYGVRTRPNGSGFGLHSAANVMKEMNGTLSAESPGLGHGATFALEIPLASPARGGSAA